MNMKKKNNKETGCLGCIWNPFDSPSDPCPDAFKDHARYCNAYSHRPVVRLENAELEADMRGKNDT